MIVTCSDYEQFKSAIAAGDSTSVFFCAAVSGVQDFSAVAAVMNTALVLRFNAASEPGSFATDFANAIEAGGFSS